MSRQFADDLETDLARGHVLEWAELYALDAISADERRSIKAFLQDADSSVASVFSDRVRTCRDTITATYTTAPLDPPADLFDRILAQLPGVAAGSTARPASGSMPAGPAPDSPADLDHGVVAGDARDELSERRAKRTSLSARAARWTVAAAAAAVLVVGGVTVAQNLQESTLEDQVLQAQDVRTEQLSLDAGGTADLAVSGSENAAVVTLTGVPAPAEGSVYQMWRIPADGSAPVSVGTMTEGDVDGGKSTEITDISGLSALAITVEPEGGSTTPTLPIVAQIPLGA
ncbi:anti-sigma factor [Arthrobacter echini]|nr:anti-sigma factor [Arthrobacter echini]